MVRLSPITSYYIRKLLYQSSTSPNNTLSRKNSKSIDALVDLDALLEQIYLDAHALAIVTQQLEKLADLHKALCDQGSLYANHTRELARLEARIFSLLGVQSVKAQTSQ
jgi:hypothetical protein